MSTINTKVKTDEQLETLLNARWPRLQQLEFTFNIIKKIAELRQDGEKPKNSIFEDNTYENNCVAQFLSFTQGQYINLLYTEFVAIIGQIKKDDFLSVIHDSKVTNELSRIKKRYEQGRNNYTAHISPKNPPKKTIEFADIQSDINCLKECFNKISVSMGMPIVAYYEEDEIMQTPIIQGLDAIINQFK